MPRVQRARSTSGYYHIMLRGNERKKIFLNDEDRIRFLETLKQKRQGDTFFIHAFCLMDNHVHLMLSENKEDVAKVMKRITVSYVSFFNKKYDRVGHLFQDRFKSEVVEQESYVLSLARYIHQNPVKAGIVRRASDYKWSSYNCYLDENAPFSDFLSTDIILGLFSPDRLVARKEFQEFMNEDSVEEFQDVIEVMDEKSARILFQQLLVGGGLDVTDVARGKIPGALVREFEAKTNLSIRKIAEITGLNKSKVHRMLRS